MSIENYQLEYAELIKSYKKGQTDAEEVGFLIVRMVQYFSEISLRVAESDISFNKKAASIIQMPDSDTGKAISAAKSERLSAASDEYAKLEIDKAHLANIEQIINALKSLQKGILNEYAHVGNT